MTSEKLEFCPHCYASDDRWHYDPQICSACGYDRNKPLMKMERTPEMERRINEELERLEKKP